ncbi:hypothetical protein FQA39_LY12361 [Lamprigera yunnana]|nr:hypothetical protein FQA39_LY12361 [Lamprigera yunnana]
MKLFGLMVLLSLTSAADISPFALNIWNDLIKDFHDECVAISNANPEQAKSIVRDIAVLKDRSVHCYLKCLYEKIDFLLPNGEFNKNDVVYEAHHLGIEGSKKCAADANPEKDVCTKAYIFGKCVVDMLVTQHKSNSG